MSTTKPPPPVTLGLELRDRGETCKSRGIPLVDAYLSGEGGKSNIAQGLWLWQGGVSLPFAEAIAGWFAEHGVTVRK